MSYVEPQVAMDELAALGSSQAIAAFLHAKRVSGLRNYCTACPAAVYLFLRAGYRVAVQKTRWSLRARVLPEGMPRTNRTPKPVREFIIDFDAGRYPELTHGEMAIDNAESGS